MNSLVGEEKNRSVLIVKKEQRFEKQNDGYWKLRDWRSKTAE